MKIKITRLLVAGLILFPLKSQSRPSNENPQSSLKAKITEVLHQAKAAHQVARTYRDWHESTGSPERTTEALNLLSQEPKFSQTLCSVVDAGIRDDIFYILDFLEQQPAMARCEKQLVKRFQKLLSTVQMRLFNRSVERLNLAQRTADSSTLGPSQEIALNATDTPLIVTGDLPANHLVLTFDDGPHATRTLELLRILAAENIRAQFFLVGRNVTLYPNVVQAEASAGHEVGCHSFTHPDMRKLTYEAALDEIESAFSALQRALGSPASFFRFPYGASTVQLRKYLADHHTPEFLWNIDTLDWKYKDPEVLLKYALEQVDAEKRGVVLFHDIQPQTLAIMPAFLQELKLRKIKLALFRPLAPRL